MARAGRHVLASIAGALGLVGVAVLGFFALLLWAFAHGGAPVREPAWEQLKDPVVVAAARQACARLAEDVAAIPAPRPGAPTARRTAAMTAENTAIDRLVRRMRGLGARRLEADPPALEWVGDWAALAGARERYAGDLVAGRPATFQMPRTPDGFRVVDRIDDVPGCAVPERLYDLPATDDAGEPVATTGYIPGS